MVCVCVWCVCGVCVCVCVVCVYVVCVCVVCVCVVCACLPTVIVEACGTELINMISRSQSVKKFPALCGAGMFITAVTSARHLSLS